jgi:hypothetical protein
MKKYFILGVLSLCMVGCAGRQKKNDIVPPSVNTGIVISTLEATKTELQDAGLSNTKVSLNIEKALTLAERLDLLLEQIEKEQKRFEDKIVKEPLKL